MQAASIRRVIYALGLALSIAAFSGSCGPGRVENDEVARIKTQDEKLKEADSLWHSGSYSEAINLYDSVLEIAPLVTLERLKVVYTAQHDTLGVSRDYKKGVRLARIAAERGDVNACNWLAQAYYSGAFSVERNDDSALLWFCKAAASGDSTAMCNAGGIYFWRFKRTGNAGDKDSAKKWLDLAINKGEKKANNFLKQL